MGHGPESVGYRMLDWDSDFFGFKVAAIVPSRLDDKELERLLGSLKTQGVTLVYWASDSLDSTSQTAALSLGGFLADRKVTYEMDFGSGLPAEAGPRPGGVEVYGSRAPDEDLYHLALVSGGHSRFKLDPRFPRDRFEALYRLWIERSTSGEIAKTVLVVRVEGPIAGMVTLEDREGTGTIGLIAVAPGREGKGLGLFLVRAAQGWFADEGFRRGRVVTQAANAAACGLYEKCGYSLAKTEHLFHFWI